MMKPRDQITRNFDEFNREAERDKGRELRGTATIFPLGKISLRTLRNQRPTCASVTVSK